MAHRRQFDALDALLPRRAPIVGVISFSAANGTPLDTERITGLIQTAFEALPAFLAAHGSYSILTGKRPSPPLE